MKELLIDCFGFASLTGFMWGAARVVAQLWMGEVRRGTVPVVLQVGKGKQKRMILAWLDGRGQIVKDRGKAWTEALR